MLGCGQRGAPRGFGEAALEVFAPAVIGLPQNIEPRRALGFAQVSDGLVRFSGVSLPEAFDAGEP